MKTQERQNIIKRFATTGNIILSTISQNLLDSYYDDRFIDDYLYLLTKATPMSKENMSEILGCSVYEFYTKNQENIDVISNKNALWEETMSNLIQQEINILILKLG